MRASFIAAFCAVIFGGVLLASCETMSAEECALADWRALGYSDAASSGATRFADRQESCNDKGYRADFEAYQSGQREGLRAFCEPNHAFAFAMRGGSFSGRCAADQAEAFGFAFADGRRVYEAQSALRSAESEMSSLRYRRDAIDRDIDAREDGLRDATTDEERRRIRDDLRDLRRERHDVLDDMRVAQDAVALRTDMVDRLRYDIGARWGAW